MRDLEQIRRDIALLRRSNINDAGAMADRYEGLLFEMEQTISDKITAWYDVESALERVADTLNEVLNWPLPQGTVETYSLPRWLAKQARDALSWANHAET